jgi:hypothetical protein
VRSIGRCAAGERTVDRADFRAAVEEVVEEENGLD